VGFVVATLGLTASLTQTVVFSDNVLLAQTVPPPNVSSIADPFASVAAQQVAPKATQQAVPQAVSPQIRQQASQKLHVARKAVATRDIATAERLLNEVNSMRLTYQENEDQPQHVHNLIQKYRQLAEQERTQGNTIPFRQQSARFNLIQADTMIRRDELDLAAQLTEEAAKQQVQYNQEDRNNGLEPVAMSRRIEEIRRGKNLNAPAVAVQVPHQPLSQAAQGLLGQAVQKLRESRAALDAGQFEQAERLARTAAAYELPEYAFQGHTPNRMLSEIAARRQGMAVNPPNQAPRQDQNRQDQNRQGQILQTAGGPPTLAPSVPVPLPGGRNTAPFIDQTILNQQVIMQQISSGIIQKLSDAQRMCQEQRKPEVALDMLYNLKREVEQMPQLDNATKMAYVQQVDRAIEDATGFRNRYSAQERQEQMNEAVLEELRFGAERFRQKEEQLQAMFKEHKKLTDEERYEEALRIAKKAKEFAPDDPQTQVLLTMSQLVYNMRRSQDIRDLKAEGFNEALLAVDRTSIVPDLSRNPMLYAADWGDLTRKRNLSNQSLMHQRPESERRINRQLEMPVTFSMDRPLPLEQALALLCNEVDIPVYIDEGALREVDVLTGTMTKMPPANGIKMKSVLTTILEQHGLAYVVKNEMLNITSKNRAKGDLVKRTYYVGDLFPVVPPNVGVNSSEADYLRSLRVHSPQLNSPRPTNANVNPQINLPAGVPLSRNGMPNYPSEGDPNVLGQYGMGGMGGGMGGGYGGMGGGMGGGMMGGMGGMGGGMMGGMGGMGGGMMGGMGGGMMGGMGGGMMGGMGSIDQIIMDIVEPESWITYGGEARLSPYPSTSSLVITQTEEAHAQIEDLLTQIRKMNDLQIAVEVRYITLTDNFFERMGTGFDLIFRNDGAFGKMSQSSNTFLDSSGNEVTSYTTKGNNTVMGMQRPGTFTSDGAIPFFQDSFGLAVPAFGGYNPAAGISTGIALLSDIEAYFFVQAAQGDQRNSVMEAPKVVLQNNMPGSIIDQTVIPFVTNVIPFVADFATGYQPVVTMLPKGQVLQVHASVANDRQHVRLTLNPTFTTIIRVESFTVIGTGPGTEETVTSSTGGGDDTSGSTSSPSTDPRSSRTSTVTNRHSGITIQQPQTATFSVSTTVNCPDGGTVLLGGIKRMSEGRIEAGTPILNKIPYLQRLFSNVAIGRETQSIMIMVTPRIIIQEEEENFILGSAQ